MLRSRVVHDQNAADCPNQFPVHPSCLLSKLSGGQIRRMCTNKGKRSHEGGVFYPKQDMICWNIFCVHPNSFQNNHVFWYWIAARVDLQQNCVGIQRLRASNTYFVVVTCIPYIISFGICYHLFSYFFVIYNTFWTHTHLKTTCNNSNFDLVKFHRHERTDWGGQRCVTLSGGCRDETLPPSRWNNASFFVGFTASMVDRFKHGSNNILVLEMRLWMTMTTHRCVSNLLAGLRVVLTWDTTTVEKFESYGTIVYEVFTKETN